MTIFNVSTAAALNSALTQVQDGDRIRLAPGKYDTLRLADRDFSTDVTITSQDLNNPATLSKLSLVRVSGVTVEHVDVVGTDLKSRSNISRVEILSSHDVTLRDTTIDGYIPTKANGVDASTKPAQNAAITGYGYDQGLAVRWSQDITIDNVDLKELFVAVYFEDVTNATFTDSEITKVREGINLTDIRNVDITNNTFHDFKGYTVDHVDMIQYWGVNSSVGVHDLTIADNLFDQGSGSSTQTIFGALSGNKAVTATDFTITGNTILNSHPNAIRLGDVDGATISDNVLLPKSTAVTWGWYPSIRLPNSTDVTVSDNVVVNNSTTGSVTGLTAAQRADAQVTESGNMLLSHQSSSSAYWADLPLPPYNNSLRSDAEIIRAMPELAGALQSDTGGAPTVRPVKLGTAGSDTLRADITGNHLKGLAGNDFLFERHGNDILEGGAGADTFFFDYRGSLPKAQHDVVLDLNFSQGDRIVLVGSTAVFDNAADPGNWLTITTGGTGVHLRDISDIEEVILSGAVTYEAGEDDTLILHPYNQPNCSIEIATLSVDDLFA